MIKILLNISFFKKLCNFLSFIGACFADGGRAFVGGSAIIGQSDVRMIIKEFRNQGVQEFCGQDCAQF